MLISRFVSFYIVLCASHTLFPFFSLTTLTPSTYFATPKIPVKTSVYYGKVLSRWSVCAGFGALTLFSKVKSERTPAGASALSIVYSQNTPEQPPRVNEHLKQGKDLSEETSYETALHEKSSVPDIELKEKTELSENSSCEESSEVQDTKPLEANKKRLEESLLQSPFSLNNTARKESSTTALHSSLEQKEEAKGMSRGCCVHL
jgi:hypothetical protein